MSCTCLHVACTEQDLGKHDEFIEKKLRFRLSKTSGCLLGTKVRSARLLV
jgi:hypothetical protein